PKKCFNVPNRLATGKKRKKTRKRVVYFEKPVKGMLSAIRQSNYRILNVRYSKKHYCLPEKKIKKPPDSIANGLKRLNNGKCISAVFKPIKKAKKKHFKIIY
ncbi:hypothetical protein GGTG_02041, partial [Gaeumannomyces tritici R3-111a-1]